MYATLSFPAHHPQAVFTRSERIAANLAAIKAASIRHISFTLGVPGIYTLINPLTNDLRKVDSRSLVIEEDEGDLIVREAGSGTSFRFEFLFHEGHTCTFAAGTKGSELHSFARGVLKSEIEAAIGLGFIPPGNTLPITYFKIGGDVGRFHMKDGRHGCVIEQYMVGSEKFLKIVSLDPRHALARDGVQVGTYISTGLFRSMEIPEETEKLYGKSRIDQMVAFRTFVSGRMSGRTTRPIPEGKRVQVARKPPLFTLATSNGKVVSQQPAVKVEGQKPVTPQPMLKQPTTNLDPHTAGTYSVPDGEHRMIVKVGFWDRKDRIKVMSIDHGHTLAAQGVGIGTTISVKLVLDEGAIRSLRCNAHQARAAQQLALAEFIKMTLEASSVA